MNLKLFFIFSILLIYSCNTNTNPESKAIDNLKVNTTPIIDNAQVNNFRKFIDKFRILTFPIILSESNIEQHSQLPLLFGSDTEFIKTEFRDTAWDKLYAYGLLPDTINTFKVIWLQPAERYVPMLTTFSKSGQKISEDYLGVGQCGSDCCYYCDENVKIYSDLTIYSADSIKSCDCDSSGPKENTMRKYVLFKTCKIAQDGKFTFAKATEKPE